MKHAITIVLGLVVALAIGMPFWPNLKAHAESGCVSFQAISQATLPSSTPLTPTDVWGGPLYGMLGSEVFLAVTSGSDGQDSWHGAIGQGRGGTYTICIGYPACTDSLTYEVPTSVFPMPPGKGGLGRYNGNTAKNRARHRQIPVCVGESERYGPIYRVAGSQLPTRRFRPMERRTVREDLRNSVKRGCIQGCNRRALSLQPFSTVGVCGAKMGELGLLAQELSDAVMAANARLDSRFCEAMNRKDVEAAMACFLENPDLVVVLYGKVLRGSAAVRQFLTDWFSGMRTVHLEIHELTRWSLGETVFAVGTATYEFEAHDGTRSTMKECWTDARQKVAGRWVYVLDHSTQIGSEA